MKKLFIAVLLVGSFLLGHKADAQKVRYYYYPQQNVYYNPATHRYAYSDNGNWTYVERLPNTYRVSPSQRVTVYGTNEEIWRDNAAHQEKYKDWGKKHKEKSRDRDRDRDHDRDHDRDRD